MHNMIKSDFYKLSHRKSIIVAPLVMAFLALIAALLLFAIFNDVDTNNTFFGGMGSGKNFILSSTSQVSLSLFLALFAAFVFAGSFSDGTIRNQVSMGYRKTEVYFSKLIVLVVLTVILSIFSFVIVGLCSMILGYGTEFTLAEFGRIMTSFALQTLVMIAYTCFFSMIASLIRTKGGAIGISLGIEIVLSFLMAIFELLALTNDSLKNIRYAFLSGVLEITTKATAFTTNDLLLATLVPLAYIIVSTAIGVAVFESRDIK